MLSFLLFLLYAYFLFFAQFVTDGVVGEVLIYAIKETVGPDAFNPTVHLAWIKIYSRMLKTMVPVAVAHELRDGSSFQSKRFLGSSIASSGADMALLNGITQGSNSVSRSANSF